RPGALTKSQPFKRRVVLPIERSRVDDLGLPVGDAYYLDVLPIEIRRVGRHGRQRLVSGDLWRDVPVGAHHDMRHAFAEDRRLVARLADNRPDVEDDLALFVRLDVKARDVHAEV